MKVQVYRNLHKGCWSVRHKGKIVAHLERVFLKNCTFHVQPAGRAKVLKEQRKNVHAYIKGELIDGLECHISPEDKRITYHPYKNNYFKYCSNGRRIDKANYVAMYEDGNVFV